MPRYTFLLPAFKGQFLDIALCSIQNQTYRDFHILVSDDYSPEEIFSIVKPYCKDPRFSYRRNQQNIGGRNLVEHWNLLIDMCDTDYLIMASDDDVFHPEFLAQIDVLTKKYPEADVLRARVQTIDGNGKVLSCDPELPEYVDETGAYKQNRVGNLNKCIANYVFKTKPLKEAGGFINWPLAWFSDIATVLQQSAHGIINTKDILFSFRKSCINISSTQQTNKIAARKKLDAALLYDKWMNTQLKRLDSDNKELLHGHKQEILRNAIMYVKVISLWELLYIILRFATRRYFDDFSQFNWLVGNWCKEKCKNKKICETEPLHTPRQ